jgi:hypothetical protein
MSEAAPPTPRPIPSGVVAAVKDVQARKLTPGKLEQPPRVAFARGALGQLDDRGLRVFDDTSLALLGDEPLEGPRAVLALADGSLLAVGSREMLRWQREKRSMARLARPVVMPRAELHADAQQAEMLWVVERGSASLPAVLRRYRLDGSARGVLLPESTIEAQSPGGGVFGVTREGVWLYLTAGHVARFGPGGARLAPVRSDPHLPAWALPARRLDQSLWIDEAGTVSRTLVSPTFKRLQTAQLAGPVLTADVGDEGRLLAAIVMTGAGPRFELELRDAELQLLARVPLPAEEPDGTDGWIQRVTQNRGLVADPRSGRVAVGGPSWGVVLSAQGERIFSIPSR